MGMEQSWIFLRTEFLKGLLQEHEKTINYWQGKETATRYNLNSTEALAEFFQSMGLGELHIEKDSAQLYVALISKSPLEKQIEMAQDAIYFECGIVTEAIQHMEKVYTSGTAKWQEVGHLTNAKYIEIRVSLSDDPIT